MTEAQAIEAIYQQWKTGWEALHPASSSDPQHVPYTFKNEAYKPDTLGTLGAWARISVVHSTSEQVTQGSAPNRKFDRRGSIYVQLFAPLNKGVALLATLAGDARTVLEGQRLTELCIYGARTEDGLEDGAWAMSVVIVPFRYTDMR